MAVTTSSSATIRGITYKKGSSFKCYASYGGAAGSEGEGSASDLTKGTTYYFYCKASGDNVTYPYAVSTTSGGSPRGWYKENVFPYATYSVKYNANGGSGAPSTQTKTYGTNLTLSSTKPTRTGHTFKGWGTSASGTSVDYAAGATYSKNAAITLYAIWTANTYTISFNANGGSGAPSSVTKTYGEALTLPTTAPTRTNYKFLGWSTSKTATTATYAAGGSFTTNATTTLHAVWELEYQPPTISSLKAVRCDADGTANDFGAYAKVTFNWECCQLLGANAVSSITVGGTSVSASGTSGSVSVVVGGSLSIETAHQISVVVVDTLKSDGSGTTTKTVSIGAAVFAVDFLSGGKGVAFGKPAEKEDYVDTNWRMSVTAGDIGFMHEHSATGNSVGMGVGSSGLNRGIWVKNADDSAGQWLIYTGGTNTYINSGDAGNVYLSETDLRMDSIYAIAGKKPSTGEYVDAFQPQNENGDTIVGWGNYAAANGNTSIYGNTVNIGVASAGNTVYQPYLTAGVSLSVSWYGAGYVTNGGKTVNFYIPLSKPTIGNLTTTVSSVGGFTIRQNNSYCYGSSASSNALPASYSCSRDLNHGVYVSAIFSNTTNVTNNSPLGIYWSGKITFS